MVNLMLISHSRKLVEGLKDILLQMAPNINIIISGGDIEGNIGSNFDEIYKLINENINEDGLVIFFDLGSSMLNSQMAIDMLDEDKKNKVYLTGTPMVETSVQVAVNISAGQTLDEIKSYLKSYPKSKFNLD